STPIPGSVREPVKPAPGRPADSGPPASTSAVASSKSSLEAQPARPEPKFELPRILFEGDEPVAPPLTSGPGHKYALGTTVSSQQPERPQTLPQRLGSGNLTLAARDPHSLFAHWDLSMDQQRGYLAEVASRHLSVRLRAQDGHGPLINET